MGFLKFLSTAFQELKPLFTNPYINSTLFNPHSEGLFRFYDDFRDNYRLQYPNRHEICKVTKIQRVKLNVIFEAQRYLEYQPYLEGLIVETDVGRDGRPVPGTGGCERFLIVRTRGASTQVIEDVIRGLSKDEDDLETKQLAECIKDLLRDDPHPTPQPGDHRLDNEGVHVSKYLPLEMGFIPFFANDEIIQMSKADISPSCYDVLDEIEVPLARDSDTCLTFYKLLLITQCVQDQDEVCSVFRRQDSWFARLILLAVQNEFGLIISDSGKGIRGEERTDFIRVPSSPTSKGEESRLPETRSESASIDNSMWKRIFISKFEEKIVQEVLELFRFRWKEDLEFMAWPPRRPPIDRMQVFKRPMLSRRRVDCVINKGRKRLVIYPARTLMNYPGTIQSRLPFAHPRVLRSLHFIF